MMFFAFAQAANVYQSQKNGTLTFSDNPSSTAKKAVLPRLSHFSENQKPTAVRAAQEKQQYQINILSPSVKKTFRYGEVVKLSFHVQPQLSAGGAIEIYLDGKKYTRTEKTKINLPQLNRGEHQLKATLLSKHGNELAQSSTRVFYVRQHSALEGKKAKRQL